MGVPLSIGQVMDVVLAAGSEFSTYLLWGGTVVALAGLLVIQRRIIRRISSHRFQDIADQIKENQVKISDLQEGHDQTQVVVGQIQEKSRRNVRLVETVVNGFEFIIKGCKNALVEENVADTKPIISEEITPRVPVLREPQAFGAPSSREVDSRIAEHLNVDAE